MRERAYYESDLKGSLSIFEIKNKKITKLKGSCVLRESDLKTRSLSGFQMFKINTKEIAYLDGAYVIRERSDKVALYIFI